MANFKRYTMVVRRDENGFATPALKVRQKGDVLKFEEVKEFLPSASSNSDYKKCPACENRNVETIGRGAFGCLVCSYVWGHFS